MEIPENNKPIKPLGLQGVIERPELGAKVLIIEPGEDTSIEVALAMAKDKGVSIIVMDNQEVKNRLRMEYLKEKIPDMLYTATAYSQYQDFKSGKDRRRERRKRERINKGKG